MSLKGKNIITASQREFLQYFSKIPDSEHFYLTGGTALSEFYYGHRRSYDIDLFTGIEGLILPFSRILERDLKKSDFSLIIIRRTYSFMECEIGYKKEKIKVEFAYDSPFRFKKPVNSELGVIVNDYKDIIVDKLLAFFGRSEPRDAVDLFFILQKENIEELMKWAKQKDPGFDKYYLAVAFERVQDFPDDINRWAVEILLEIDAKEIKHLFHKIAMDIMEGMK